MQKSPTFAEVGVTPRMPPLLAAVPPAPAGVAVMLVGLVDHGELLGLERAAQLALDPVLANDRAGSKVIVPRVLVGICVGVADLARSIRRGVR